GDLLNPGSVRRAVEGVQTVFHVAADYRLWTPNPEALYRTNVDGTRVVLEVAGEAGVNRVVHTSSVAALGAPRNGEPGTEDTAVTLDELPSHYDRSNSLAEQLALHLARGRLLAAERGKPGERYILGHQNLHLSELFALMAEITGRRPPRLTVPYAMAWMAATCCEGLATVTRRPPAVTLAAVRMARKGMYF